MNFEDEHYVRVYTRDTKTVKKWQWAGRTLFWELLRKADKAGLIEDVVDVVEDLALITDLPVEVVQAGLPRLRATGAVELRGTCLVIPRYLEAQTVSKSDKLRSKETRARRAAEARLSEILPIEPVTIRDAGDTKRDAPTEEGENLDEPRHDTGRDGADTKRDASDPSRDQTSREPASASPNAVQRRSVQRSAEADPRLQGQTPVPPPAAPHDLESSLELGIQDRAQYLLDNPPAFRWTQPNKWPEIQAFATRISTALGWHSPRLTTPDLPVVRKLVEIHAAFTTTELIDAIEEAPQDKWLQGKSLGLGSLSVEVISRLVNGGRKAQGATTGAGPSVVPAETTEQRERRRQIQAERDEEHRRKLRAEAANMELPGSLRELMEGVG